MTLKFIHIQFNLMVVFAFLVDFFASSEAMVQHFVQQPYRNWMKFNNKVKAHLACSVHSESVLAMKSFSPADRRVKFAKRSIVYFTSVLDCPVHL